MHHCYILVDIYEGASAAAAAASRHHQKWLANKCLLDGLLQALG